MNLSELQTSPAAFREALLIDCDGKPTRLGEVLDPWQRDDFLALDPGWQCVAGQEVKGAKLRAWIERPRGHSKSLDILCSATWALFASRNQISGIVAAVDRDQARLDRNHVERFVRLNPWLETFLKVDQQKITNKLTGSTLEILASDVMSSYGILPDFAILDELTIWPKRDLFDSIFSATAKRKNCLLLCIGNAGFCDSWQWELREKIKADPRWHFSRLNGPVASWITDDRLEEQRKLLPPMAYGRLWANIWGTGSGDALDHADIDAAVVLDGPLSQPEKGWCYLAGLDLAVSRDNAALAVVGRHVGWSEESDKPKRIITPAQQFMIDNDLLELAEEDEPESVYHEGTGRLKLAAMHVWHPQDSGGKVSIETIENVISVLDKKFQLTVGCDPWQAAYLIERLQKKNLAIHNVDFIGSNLKSMCSATLESFAENKIDLFDHPDLITDLKALRVVEKSYGVRLESPRGPRGHGDAATALAIALHLARKKVLTRQPVTGKILVWP